MNRHHELQAAVGASSLGMLADAVVLATVHFRERGILTEQDRGVLGRAAALLRAVAELGGNQVVGTNTLQGMASIDVLDGTLEAVMNARPSPDEATIDFVKETADKIENLLQGSASDEIAGEIAELFEKLAVVTLRQGEEIVENRGKRQWMHTASHS